jgi:hypothetical protein
MQEEISVVVVCKPMWQNMSAYQIITKIPCPHINVELLTVSTQNSFSCRSQIKCYRTHIDMNLFSCFGMWNSCPIFVSTFRLHPGYAYMETSTLIAVNYSFHLIYFFLTKKNLLWLIYNQRHNFNIIISRGFLSTPEQKKKKETWGTGHASVNILNPETQNSRSVHWLATTCSWN